MHVVAAVPEQLATKPSSMLPLQLSSLPSQAVSLAAGVPGAQLSWTVPLTQLVVPVRAQAPKPQIVP
jgi:hypothetical protein